MNKEMIQAFTARIAQASRSELIVILYEMALAEIAEAKKAYEAGDLATFDRVLKKSHKYINELIVALDYNYAISYDLLSLYLYVNKRIITAIIRRKPDTLDSAESVLKKLLVGFEGVSKTDKSGPVMRNTHQLYAGLTYGRGKLNEIDIDPSNGSRGFIA
ncbi:MAG: flagellar protein FliS [Clostridiales bacterium]|nr:flagellar protein FliS [Clostridiales bacterium]